MRTARRKLGSTQRAIGDFQAHLLYPCISAELRLAVGCHVGHMVLVCEFLAPTDSDPNLGCSCQRDRGPERTWCTCLFLMIRSSSFLTFESFGVSSPFDPTFHYVTSPIFPPVVLGALRLLFAVYTFTTVIITLALYQDPDSSVVDLQM